MARRTKTILAAAWIPVAFATGLWLRYAKPWETPAERAYRVCSECGLSTTEIAWLIGVMHEHPLARYGIGAVRFLAGFQSVRWLSTCMSTHTGACHRGGQACKAICALLSPLKTAPGGFVRFVTAYATLARALRHGD